MVKNLKIEYFVNFFCSVSHFTSLLDICLAQDCYKSQQKQLLQSWKFKLNSICKGSSGVKKSKFKLKTRVNNEEKTFPISYWRSNETEPVIMTTQKRLSLQTDETKNNSKLPSQILSSTLQCKQPTTVLPREFSRINKSSRHEKQKMFKFSPIRG